MGDEHLSMDFLLLYAVQLMPKALCFCPDVGLSNVVMEGFNWCRRLSKDYEILPQTHETFVQVAMIRLMLRRLA